MWKMGKAAYAIVAHGEDKDLTCNLNDRKRGKKSGRNLFSELMAVCILNG